MALTFTLVDTWDDGQRIHVAGTVAASGSYSTGGDTLAAWMEGSADYAYNFLAGSAMNNGKMKVFAQGTSAGAFPELAASAYPGAITGDTITFYGIFKKLQ